jgi:hypothetical protein
VASITLLGFIPIISAPSVGTDEWDVTAEVDDPTERFSGFDVSVGDIVFLDLLSSTSAPNTAGRYVVRAVLSRAAGDIRVILAWGGVDVAVDPVEGAGHRGYLTKASERNNLAWHPAPRVLMIDPDLIQAARNTESFAIIDLFSTGSAGSSVDQTARDRQVRAVPTDRTFTIGQVVTRRGGVTDLACPQIDERMPALGIALGMGAGTVLMQTSGIISNPVFSFIPGLPIFVSDTGGITQDASSITLPGWLQPIGIAIDTTIAHFAFTGVMTKRH